MSLIQLLLGLVGIVGGVIGLITYRQHKQAGRNEAILEAAKREAAQGRERGKIDSDVGARSPDDLERVLRGKPNP